VSRGFAALLLALGVSRTVPASATTYYVRQTVGDDQHDGRSAATAWQHMDRLGPVLVAGDTAYVGPGLYREQLDLQHDGTVDRRITLVADVTGQHTGDPPGAVMLVGSDPADETVFTARPQPGVFAARLPSVLGVVEMDGPQTRYVRAEITHEHIQGGLSECEVVAKLPSSLCHEDDGTLLVHTSDGRPPAAHELEVIRRGSGIFLLDRHFVTVNGFTVRHVNDGAINVFKGSSDVTVTGVTAWGSRQGVRVYAARNVVLYGNTLFRNENSGAYFAAGSTSGAALANVTYENAKGLRWSSDSTDALVLDNWCFENTERGLSLENADRALVRRNLLAGNAESQLLVIQSDVSADENCYQRDRPAQAAADYTPYPPNGRYDTLDALRAAQHQDTHGREGDCGARPAKVDVHRLHAETTAYAERARQVLSGKATPAPPPARGWLDWALGR